MRINVKQTILGNVSVKDGKLIATDPCYEPEKPYNHTVEVKKGEYIGRAVYGVLDEWWGERVIELTINHESTPKKKAVKLIGHCAVDSGQCGFFLYDDYCKHHPEKTENEKSEKWYRNACKITLNDKNHNVGVMLSSDSRHRVGFVSSSGLGDGYYNLYAGFNNRGEITALRLRFL